MRKSHDKQNKQNAESSTNVSEKELKSTEQILHKRPKIQFRTSAQEKLWNLIDEHEIVMISGPAGTGKSHISVAKAIELIATKKYKRIIIIKPVVEADEHLGFLPGDVDEKLTPYTFSTYYLFEKILGKRRMEALEENEHLVVMALAYLRGVNIDNSVLIFEEAQNCTPKQMKTLLTRIGENSKFIISGDLEQSDRYKFEKDSGLYIAIEKLKDLLEIGTFEFTQADIVRNPIIGKILKKLNGSIDK
ncbi:MAG: PhoH family protein [Clostridia bacterium]|jgi:phosphate starvation-inducible PhoH-like protein